MDRTTRRAPRLPLTAVLLGIALSSVAGAVTFPVTKTADTADGVCDADCSLREAIIAANAAGGPDTITLPAGTYVLTIAGTTGEDASADGDLDIGSGGLTINGAGTASTIVDGNNAIRVFEVVGSGAVTFSRLTVRNGLGGFGGGIENDNAAATVTIDQSAILNNQGNFGGGINNNSTGTIIITDSTVSGNTATGFGGGINNNVGGTVTLADVTVANNTAQGFGGGGVNNNSSGTMTITGSQITLNTAQNGGGVNNNSSGSMTLTDTNVSSNTGTDTSPGGGGILNNSSGPMTIIGSTISANTSAGPGGGIANNSGGAMTITNSTVSGNTSTDPKGGGGGGVYRGSIGAVALTNVTVTGNSAPEGGGLLNNRLDSPITVLRSIVANSVSGGNCAGVISSLGNNLSSDATCNLVAAGDLPNTNPMLAPLDTNGGLTRTHALLAGSPAINAGGAGCPPPGTDQRGVARPQGAACEIGSFECQTGECGGVGATPTPTPTGAPPTATPTGVPPTATATPTVPTGAPVNVPTLSFPMLALLGLALGTVAVLLLRR